jgi:hypothetical protein
MNLTPLGPDDWCAIRPFRRIDDFPDRVGYRFGRSLQLRPGAFASLNRWADEFGSLYKLRMRRMWSSSRT